jgi:hypothetical protein
VRFILAVCLTLSPGVGALAQNQSENPQAPNDALGRPLKPDAKRTLDTTAPLSPAASPQGETPPGNMAAQLGSSQPVKPKSEPQK